MVPFGQADRFVRRRYRRRAGRLRPLGAGEWSRAYAFTLDGRQVVARFGRYLEDFTKDRRMARHASARLPIPAVLEVGAAPGGYFAVSRRAHGQFFDGLDGDGMRRTLPGLLRTLDAVAAVDTSATTGFGAWGPDGSAPHPSWAQALLDIGYDHPQWRTHGWRAALAASPTGTDAFDRGYTAMRELVGDCPDHRQVIHSDLLYRNVLVRRGAVTGMFDWANSLYGDRLYDLAWLLFWWPWYPAWQGVDVRTAIGAHLAGTSADLRNVEERLRCYQIHIGLDTQAYQAFTRRWDDLARAAAQTLALVTG